ncbi:MAG: Fis family transcriptional regulator [Thermus sp.]
MELFSEEWAQVYCRKLNGSEAYQKAAATWEGSHLRADPAMGVESPKAVVLDLWHGHCRGAKAASEEEAMAADFVIEGDLATWQEVLEGRAEPLVSLMRGELELKKGSLAALAPYVQAARELVRVAREVL